MTLHEFLTISRHIATLETKTHGIRPNAICVSRKLYETLKTELEAQSHVMNPSNDNYEERVNGLVLFVDDDMPDDYYQVGQAKTFIDILTLKKKLKRIEK